MANLLSWLGGVANGIGGQINRTANQVQRNVVNPAVNFGVRNVQQAQRNVAQLPANVQRGAFDLQQQANNARKQAEEEARRIAEQRTREIMSIGNQAQQGIRQVQQGVGQIQNQAVNQVARPVFRQVQRQIPQPPRVDFAKLAQNLANAGNKSMGLNQSDVDSLRDKSPIDRANFLLKKQTNDVLKNPAMAIVNSPLNPLVALNQTYSKSPIDIPKPDLTKNVDDISDSIAQSEFGKNPAVGFIGQNMVKPIVRSVGRVVDTSTGQEQYSEGAKGLAEYGTDAFNVGSLAYTPVKAGVLAKGGMPAVRAIPGAMARGAGAAGGTSALNQYAETGKVDPATTLLSAGIGAGANLLPGVGGVLARGAKGGAKYLNSPEALTQGGFTKLPGNKVDDITTNPKVKANQPEVSTNRVSEQQAKDIAFKRYQETGSRADYDKAYNEAMAKNPNAGVTKGVITGKLMDVDPSQNIAKLASDKKLIAKAKAEGYVGLKGKEHFLTKRPQPDGTYLQKVDTTFVFDGKDVKSRQQLIDIYNKANSKPINELAPKPGKTPMKPGSDSFKTDTVENIIKDLKGVSQEFRDKVGSNINKNISVEEVPFSKLIRTKTPASKRLSSVEKLGSTDYVTVIKEGNRYRPVDGQHRIAVAENSGKSSLKMIVANSDSNMTTEQIKNQFGKAIAPEPKTAKVSIAELQKNDTLGLMNTKDDIAAGRLSRTKGPVEVVKTSEGHLLIDGNHRALEAQMAGKSTVDAIVLSPEEAMKKYGDYLPQLKFVLDATGDLPVDKLNRPIYETAPKPTKLPTTPGGTPLKPVNTNRIFDYKSDGVRPVIDPKHKSRVKVYENPYYKGSWSVVVDGKYAGELPNGGASAGNIYKIRDLLTEGRAIKAQDPETADIFKGLQPPKTVYELAPKPKESLPDVIQAGKEDVYYHGTTKSDAESMLKTGFNPKLSVRGKNTESPYALFVSKDKGRLAGDHSAGNYGDGTIVKVTPNTDVKLLDGQSRTWVDSMGQSRGAKESAEWAKKLQKQGYDGIQEANGEITILNPSKFTISEVSPKVKPPTIPSKNKVLPKGINKDDVVEAHQFGSTTKGMVGNDTDIAIFLDPEHPSFAKIGSEYNKKVGKTEYHVFPDNDEGHAVFDAMLDYKDPKYGTGKGIAVKLNKDTIFSTDSIKKDRFGVPFKEESVPVAKLTRNQEYQPRIGQSGEATTANVFKKGYQEGLSDQPMLVRKEGDKYTVLGGHSRTMGIEQRAKAGLDNPTNIKARVYENITDEQARQISRGANQGAQYESTLDMAKSISASISENKAPSVQKQNMVKGFGHDDYKYLWDVVKDNNILKEKVNAGGISAEETLAIARQGRVKGLEPEKVAGVIQGLDKAGKLTRQNAKNVINLLSGKIKAGQMRTNQIGMFGDVEKAVKAVDLLDEYQKVSAELVKKRNALAIATDTLDKKSPAYKELRLKVKEYGQKLKTVETEVVNQYNAKISKNVPEIPSKTPPPPKPPTKKVRMNEYGELQVKERGFVTTVKNSPQTTPEVAKGVKGKYEPINNIDTLDTARKEVGLGKSGRVNNKKAYEEAIYTAKRSEDYSTETQAQSLILIEHLQSKGRTQDAIDIVEKMSERATKNGQASQILAAYNRLKPEGVLMMAQREIDKAKAMNPTKYADLKIEKVQATKLRKMATELQGLTGDERIVAQKEMLDEIGRLVPTPNMTKAVTLWKAGLLTGIKGGVSGNAVGNASNILVKKIADAPASAIDTVITQFTGNRSKVFTLKGWLSGFGEGLKDGKKQIQLGTGADDLASKLDYKKVYFSKNNPAGRFAQKYTDFVFGFYSASDKPWKMAALKNSLTDLATVEAKNKGLKGAAKAKFIKETVEAPPDNLLVQATNDSLDATFQDATALGGMLSGAKRSLAKHGPVAGAVGEVVAPFTGIPSSVATKMYRYSLVSSAVDIVRAIKASNKGQFDQAAQRKVSESIGKGLTGTALLGTGYALWNAGLMTTGMPQDPKERDLWELEGKQPWSVKVGGEWLSLNYTGPVLAILGAGATAAQSIKEGNTLPQTAFIAGMGTAKAVLESSPLKGVQSTLDVISDPARNGPRYLESLAGSTIPTISADVASSIDPLQREAMSPLDAMTNRVPIWRYGLNPKLNPFGEPKANQAFGVQAIVDPFRMSEDRTTSLTTELRNLYNTNKDLGTMPSDFKKDFYGGDTKLNEKQIYDLTAKIKPEIKQAWEQIIADPRYQGLNPEQRKKVLDKAAEDIRAARKFETGVQGGFLNEGEARKKLETGAKRILRGGQTDYINKETGGEDTPKQKYETALNDYEDKKKNGEISSIDEIKIQKALKKLQAQSNFDQDTVDLYGLSLKEIDGYLKSQPNGGDIYQKLLALDDAMEAAGATRKFKNRKLVVSSGKKSTKGRKAKKGGKAKKGTAIKIPSISGSAYKAPKFVTRKIASRKLSTKALPKIKAGKVYV